MVGAYLGIHPLDLRFPSTPLLGRYSRVHTRTSVGFPREDEIS